VRPACRQRGGRAARYIRSVYPPVLTAAPGSTHR